MARNGDEVPQKKKMVIGKKKKKKKRKDIYEKISPTLRICTPQE